MLVAELAERWSVPKPWIWIEVRELFSEGEEGKSARALFEQARARKAQDDPADGLDPPSEPRRYGMQVYRASPERSARLVELHALWVRSGRTPALADIVERQMPQAILAGRLLDPLPRAEDFDVQVRFGNRWEPRNERFAYGAGQG